MGAALALASVLGVCQVATAEVLPAIEAVMVRKINEQNGGEGVTDISS